MRVLTAMQMRQVEEKSLEFDLTYQRLMENAGSAAAAFIRRTFSVSGLNIMIFCSKGNNGGDGLVVARKLAEDGANVVVVLMDGIPLSPEATSMYSTAMLMKLPMLDFDFDSKQALNLISQADIIIDAICGTGFHGILKPNQRIVCKTINKAIAAVISLDIPTGIECDTGNLDEDALHADFTIVFDSKKPVHFLPKSLPLCGTIEVVDIGIPQEAYAEIVPFYGTIKSEDVFLKLKPRAVNSHKGTFGSLLNISGCQNYLGAATLSTLGALRCGVGLVTLASTQTVCNAVSTHILESTYLPLAANEFGGISFESSIFALKTKLAKATAVLFGCGLGNTLDSEKLLELIIGSSNCPIIIDADGINCLAKNIHVLEKASAPVVITPHSGEFARLCGVSVLEIEEDRQGYAMRFSALHNITVVLKGAGTVIAYPNGLMLNQTGNSGLAKGGSGDILAGMIGAFLAQGLPCQDAAIAAVHLHGLAADRTALRRSAYAMLPSEILEDLANIFAEQNL